MPSAVARLQSPVSVGTSSDGHILQVRVDNKSLDRGRNCGGVCDERGYDRANADRSLTAD